MKKLLSMLALAAITLTASAQTFKKSDKILEGTVAYSKAGDDVEYSIAPSVGYFVTDGVAVGVSAQYGEDKDLSETTTGVGAFVRCYFLNIGKNFKAYSQLGLGNATTKISDVKTSTFGVGVGMGANYFVSKKVALTAQLVDLASYTSTEGASAFSIGFTGVKNPFSMATFGVLVKL